MPLDPQVVDLLEKLKALRPKPTEEMTVEEARAAFLKIKALAGPPRPVAKVEDSVWPGGIPVRIYTPEGARGALVYYHGGGWVIGGLETCDIPCRALAHAANCVVVSVDYRLAPEHKFPIPLQDCLAAAEHAWKIRESLAGPGAKLALGGDSAGGNLAAAVAALVRDQGTAAPSFQLLIYPVTNYDFSTPSYHDNAEGYVLTTAAMKYYWAHYLPNPEAGADPRASILRNPRLNDLPEALVITAEYDPLRDEGEAYARKLQAAGVQVDLRRFEGLVHGFFQMAGVLDRGARAADEVGAVLKRALRA